MTSVCIKPNHVSRNLDRLFDDFFAMPSSRYETESVFTPRVNIQESKEFLLLTFEVPGIDKKEIKVTVKDNLLTVSGSREFKSEEKETNWVRLEMRTGQFSRSFTLPKTVDPEKVTADYKNGLLEIRLEKFEQVKPKEIEVKIG